jgi:hypothetical protein
MNIFDQPWTKTRVFNEEPICSVLTGGWETSEITPEVENIAQWAASELSNQNGGDHSIVKIRDVIKQIVSGVNYKLTLELLVDGSIEKVCELNIYDQSWTNTREFTEQPNCYATKPIIAGWEPTEVTDKVNKLAEWATSQLGNSEFTQTNVKNLYTQLVNGMNYKFDLELIKDGKVSLITKFVFFLLLFIKIQQIDKRYHKSVKLTFTNKNGPKQSNSMNNHNAQKLKRVD